MATSGDIRDIMDLGHNSPRQSVPKKKKKLGDTQPRLSGISREVQALMGDSVPPVAIIEVSRYKSKPSLASKRFKVRHWEDRSFTHGARIDHLQLRHWKRSIPGTEARVESTPDANVTDGQILGAGEPQFEDEFPSEKWNVSFEVTSYNDDQYESYLKSENWTKEETDYLIGLCRDYNLRWHLIQDRYDPSEVVQTSDRSTEGLITRQYPARTMEAMKARYYAISAKMLESQTPASQMTNIEFSLWEKMRSFDAKAESTRKAIAEKLFERTKDEAEEEKMLLEELHRITKNEEDFIKMRKDLYTRLETAPSLRRNERGEEQSTALYQSSHGLSVLLSTLLAKERKLKRPVQSGPDSAVTAATPTDAKPRQGNQSRRETIDSQAEEAGPMKKGSMSQPVIKPLTPAEEVKYGVSHPQERLTSGVMFRHEKINRITTAKSQVQTQKIQSALTELGIPPRLLMPTERVCREFERLVTEVQILLDSRRLLEKVSSEIKVLEEHRNIRLGQLKERENSSKSADVTQADTTAVSAERNQKNERAGGDRDDEDADAIASREKDDTAHPQHRLANEDTDMKDAEDEDDEEEEEEDDGDVDQSAVADNDDDDEDADPSIAAADEDDIEADIEDLDDDDDDAPGLEDLEKAHQITDEEDEDEEEDGEEVDRGSEDEEDDDEEQDDGDEAGQDTLLANGGDEEDHEEDNDDDEDEEEAESGRPTSSQSANIRSHKRSASIVSEASRAGSNRSGAGRKKRR